MKGPIIIAGFGRSGTTWLSDILSKALGGLMLFEPFHPLVCAEGAAVTYSSNPTLTNTIISHWEQLLSGPCTNRWLIRNHLRSPIDSVPEHYIQDIWKKSPVIGYKTIRTNHLLESTIKVSQKGAVVYIIRHPLAILASINNRHRFWEEFGWTWHYKKFLKELKEIDRPELAWWLRCEKDLQTPNEQIIFMWTVSQEIALSQVKSVSGCVICYEDLYMKPFEETLEILSFLGHSDRTIHPSYLFEPSLTTHRTFHNSSTGLLGAPDQLPKIFWESSIKEEEEKRLLDLIRKLNPSSSEVLRYLQEI